MNDSNQPLDDLEEWENFVTTRYPEKKGESSELVGTNPNKKKEQFRDYEAEARDSVKEFYRLNHQHQTLDFVEQKKAEYLKFDHREMGIWDAMEYLNTLVDDSDPDTDLSQLDHLLQTAEAIRSDGHEDWFILTGLIHDLGKILCLFGEPQWAVVGDTFPVGCAFSNKIVYHKFFNQNPDSNNPEYQSQLGIYEKNCGLDNVHISWGHDEYLYHVVKDYIPEEGLYMIRYHSFYPAHRENAYDYLMNDHDRDMFEWVKKFNPYDLYSKSDTAPGAGDLRPYYENLISKYFPATLNW